MSENNESMEASKHETMQTEILDAYFRCRRNCPGRTLSGEEFVSDPKTTAEIAAELRDMYEVSVTFIVKYMREHDYEYTTLPDGSIKWDIWRNIHYPL